MAVHTITCVHKWAATPVVVHRARGVIAWLTLYWAEPSATWSSVLGLQLARILWKVAEFCRSKGLGLWGVSGNHLTGEYSQLSSDTRRGL